jgi:serine/threonine protein kinase/Tol biopolymer transport system component
VTFEPNPDLLDLATTVADGTPVDWPEVAASGSDADRQLIEGLRLLERVAEVHASAVRPASRAGESPDDPPAWGGLRIREVLGRGTSGRVYRAWDGKLDRDVALKLVEPGLSAAAPTETLSADVIIEEGRLLARVRHPGVVTVHGADRINGRVGIWMELVEGQTLDTVVREHGPLPPGEIQDIGRRLAEALAAVHGAGLIHRDIKAQNVMRDGTRRIVLMDFGTGLAFAEDAETVALAGTPLYLAPEVIEGTSHATVQSDVYALGVLLFYLATGDFPVRGNTLGAVRRAHAKHDRRPVSGLRPDLPPALARVIDRALAVSPSGRFSSAATMAAALEAIGANAARRRRAFVSAAALALVAAASLAIASMFSSAPAGPKGMSWTSFSPELIRSFNLRGPAVDGHWAPCTSPWGSRNVALCNLTNGDVRILRESPRTATIGQVRGRSLVSPDARRLAYVWEGEPERQKTLDIVNVDGSGHRVLFSLPANDSLSLESWTPDGVSLVTREQTASLARLVLVPVAGGPVREVARLIRTDQGTALSPDGRTLVVERLASPANADLVAIDVTTGREVWRYDSPTHDASPLWQPDGRGVIFVSNQTGCRSIVRLPVVGQTVGRVEVLHDVGSRLVQLSGFGAGGELLVSLADRDAVVNLVAVDLEAAESGTPRALLSDCSNVALGADWSPDGSRIAYVRGSNAGDQAMSVAIGRADGGALADHPVAGRWMLRSEARWSPDGLRIAVTHADNQVPARGGLSVVEVADGKSTLLARPVESAGGQIRRPRWDLTGRRVLYQNIAIRRVDLRGANNEEVYFPTPEEPGQRVVNLLGDAGFDVATDGALVLGVPSTADPADCRLRIVEPDGTEVDRHIFTGEICHGITWSRDGARILVATFTRSGIPVSTLWLLGRLSGEPRKLLSDTRPLWDLALSPDSRRLLFTLGASAPTWGVLAGIPGVPAGPAPSPGVPARVQTMRTEEPVEVTLSGRVTDADGRPLQGLYVYSYRRVTSSGRSSFVPEPQAEPTDRDGRYRLAGRPPGEYVLHATTRVVLSGSASVRRAPLPIIGPDGVKLGYVNTLYRAGSTDAFSVVRIESGERADLDIQLERRRMFSMRGSVVGIPAGQPVPPTIVALVQPEHPHLPVAARVVRLSKGKFEFDDTPEGTYRITLDAGELSGEVLVQVSGAPPPPITLVLRRRAGVKK